MSSQADGPYRRLVAALWVLVRTASTTAAELDAAAQRCCQCVRDVMDLGSHFVLQERHGALFANGARIRPDVQGFAATAGITALMQDNRVSELLLLPTAGPEDLAVLGRCWHDAGASSDLEQLLRSRGCIGVHVAHGDPGPDDLADVLVGTASSPSQLGAVFTMQQFAQALGPPGPLSGVRARVLLQSVLHRMLRSSDGLEPLARVQRDPYATAAAVRACVLAVRTAEELEWGDDRSIGAGVAALLGPAETARGDAEVVELARAAHAVVAMLDSASDGRRPEEQLQQLQLLGQLPAFMAGAMEQALAVTS